MEELKRIYKHFIDILIKASSELVKNWDKDTLNRAFAWAAYCQTLHQVIKESEYLEDLKTEFENAAYYENFANLSNELKDPLELLEHGETILCKMLLCNPSLDSRLSYILLPILAKDDSLKEMAVQWCVSKKMADMAQHLQKSFLLNNHTESNSPLLSHVYRTLARLLLHRLISSNKRQEIMDTLFDVDNGLTVAVVALTLTCWNDESKTDIQTAQKTLLSLIEQHVSRHNGGCLWQLNADIIRVLCSKSPRVYSSYIHYVISVAQDLDVNALSGQIYLRPGRSIHDANSTYNVLLSQLQVLSSGTDTLAHISQLLIREQSACSTVWLKLKLDLKI